MAQISVAAEPDVLIAALCDFALENLRKKLIASDVHRFLRDRDMQIRRLVADGRTSIQIEELRQDFVESIRPHLAAGQMIPRPEADGILSLLDAGPPPEVVIVHGPTGVGKTGVLYQLAEGLNDRGIPFIAVRLDRRAPRGSPRAFGADIGLCESPVICLEQLSAGGRAVLILDQLDALRWTRAHAAEGLDVCKTLLREVCAQRTLGRNLSVVIACRTFDLEHDPEIRQWVAPTDSRRFEKVEVKRLPDDTVREVVRQCGTDPNRLAARRLSLLASVHNLAMWADIVRSGEHSPDFDSATQLMREFWRHKRREVEKAGYTPAELDVLLKGLVDHMEHNATLSGPSRLIESSQGLSNELQSLGILQVSGRSVMFCHQSYLDFLIADRAVVAIDAGSKSVLDWLGDRSRQSLFRREQLRQLLFLLADENINRFQSAICDLLGNPETRYHIKLLTLEALGQVTPSTGSSSLVREFLANPEWREHVLQVVAQGSAEYVGDLAKAGILQAWLSGDDVGLAGNGVWLLSSVVNRCGDLVAEVCRPYLAQGNEKAGRVASILHRSTPDTEADSVFELRLACIGAGIPPLFVPWKDLAERKPDRALRLLSALSTRGAIRHALRESRGSIFGIHSPADRKAVIRAAAQLPKLAWNLLQPRLIELARQWDSETADDLVPSPADVVRVPRILVETLRAAGRRLARRAPDLLLASAVLMGTLRSRVVQRILVETLAALPPSYADVALRWLLDDLRRLRCGSRRHLPRWLPAKCLLAAMSPHCSDEVFADVERVLLRYRDPQERKLAQFWLHETRYGIFRNQFGAAQFFLLPALSAARRSKETTGRMGVLARKFCKRDEEFFASPRSRGGWVRSPLDRERIDHLSDGAWLRIISNARLARHPDRRRVRKYLPGSVIESSVEMFSRDFGVAALREPERFARLASMIPANAPSDYLAAVLHAVTRRNPPSEVPEDRRSQWAPAPPESFEAVLERVPREAGSWLAQQYCHALVYRDDISLTEPIVDRLLSFCNHCDPEPDALHIYCDQQASQCSVEVLEQNAINCVRAVAARAIASVLFRRPDLCGRFRPTIERLLADPHPVVRVAAVRICLATWNSDRSVAVTWLLRAAADDERVAACHDAHTLYNCAFPAYAQELIPLIRRMIDSQIDEVAEAGAAQAAGRWIFFGLIQDELERCCVGSVAQRKGVAASAAQLVTEEKHFDRSRTLLERFLDDPDSNIRAAARIFLRYDRFLTLRSARPLLLHFVRTRAFQDDPTELMFALERNVGALLPFADVVLRACGELCRGVPDAERGFDRRFHAGDQLSSLLLRLYEQSERPEDQTLRQRCLDAWDDLLKNGVGPARSLTQQLDART